MRKHGGIIIAAAALAVTVTLAGPATTTLTALIDDHGDGLFIIVR